MALLGRGMSTWPTFQNFVGSGVDLAKSFLSIHLSFQLVEEVRIFRAWGLDFGNEYGLKGKKGRTVPPQECFRHVHLKSTMWGRI
jgi:hypothetical protein